MDDLFDGNLFDSDLFQLDDNIYEEAYDIFYKYKFGDLIIYDINKNNIDIIYKNEESDLIDKKLLGIIIKQNDDKDSTIDIMLKSFLTSDGIILPSIYYDKPKNIIPYIYLLFNRYCNKFKRISNINIDIFNFYIPYIVQLDYIYKNIDTFFEILNNIYDDEKLTEFKTRFYNHGIICQHKNKYYQWLPNKDVGRTIHNLDILKPYEFLPFFTLKFNN